MFMTQFDCGNILPGTRLEGCFDSSDSRVNTKQNNTLLDHWAQIERVTTDEMRVWERASHRLRKSLSSFRRQAHRGKERTLSN